jgi:hypothetical protein
MLLALTVGVASAASVADAQSALKSSAARSASRADVARREYGMSQTLGNGKVRTYVVRKDGNGAPIEIGVAISESAMEGLPAPMNHGGADKAGHVMGTEILLDLPANHGTQFKFVQLDWNPAGHEPPGVYDVPHFDFHFYNITKEERDAIVPSNPQYVASARNAPDGQSAREFFVNPAVALKAPAEAVAVPKMGVHWLDARSPELQGLVGNPQGFKPFTATYIQGAWNGKFIFEEPMITRAHIMARKAATDSAGRDQIIPLSSAVKASPAGYYPAAYRITYDPAAKEYRIALTQLAHRE